MNRLNVLESANLLKNFEDVAIVFHKNPDGDALGAALALCLGLQQLNRRCKILGLVDLPECFKFLFEGFSAYSDFDYKKIVAVDLASSELLDDAFKNVEINLVIDHHLNNDVLAEFCLIDSKAAATCEIVFDLLNKLGVKFNKQIATSIYIGLATDTGCFKFKNTTARTHEVAAMLFGYGVNFADINHSVFDLRTRAQLSLQNLAFSNLCFVLDGRCAVVFVTEHMMKSCGCAASDFFVVTNMVKNIEGVVIAVSAREIEENSFKFSVRTGADFSASEFCAQFGGGGHEKAAGFELNGEIDVVKAEVLKKLKEFFLCEGFGLC